MSEHPGEVRSRRELFAGALRYAALSLIAACGAAVFAKRRRLVREGKCVNAGICAGCRVFERCDLPEALTARQTREGDNNDKK